MSIRTSSRHDKRGEVLCNAGVIVTHTLNPVLDRTLTAPRLAFDDVLRATSGRRTVVVNGLANQGAEGEGVESAGTGQAAPAQSMWEAV